MIPYIGFWFWNWVEQLRLSCVNIGNVFFLHFYSNKATKSNDMCIISSCMPLKTVSTKGEVQEEKCTSSSTNKNTANNTVCRVQCAIMWKSCTPGERKCNRKQTKPDINFYCNLGEQWRLTKVEEPANVTQARWSTIKKDNVITFISQ